MAEKVTKMVIKVDLQCWRCYKKIKKILCQFPQEIRDQTYNEKQNTVSITVVCCSPEKIQQMIICKGGKTVQSVEILHDKAKETPEKKQPPENKPVKPPPVVKEPPKTTIPVDSPLVLAYPMVGVCCCPPGYGGYGGGPCYCGRRRPVICGDGCGRPAGQCKGGNRGSCHGQGRLGLCDDGCGRLASACQGGNRGFYPRQGRPVMCDDGCGRLACECRGRRGYYVSPCDYFSEENATGCTIM